MFRFLRSSTFHFTLLYVAIFAVSAVAVLSFVYQAALQDIEGQIKNIVNSQIGQIKTGMEDGGRKEAVKIIDELITRDFDRMSFFMLINPDWQVIAGNVDTWPGGSTRGEAWITFIPKVQRDGGTYWAPALARTVTLPGNYLLMVGYNLWHVQKLRSGITHTFYIIITIIFAVGIIGGILLTKIVKRRVERLNQVCRKVMAGHLNERVQVSGSGDEFDMLSQNFNAMMGRINELVDGIRVISHNIAHDLRTPLNRMRNRLENMLVTRPQGDAVFTEIKAVTKDIDLLVATFNAILRISEAESGAGTELFAVFDFSQITQDVYDFYAVIAEEKNIKMRQSIAPSIQVNGDRHLLSQAIANLLDNAIKYTPDGGEINVELKVDGDFDINKGGIAKACLSIADTGSGIPEEFREKVKERFYRLEKSRSTKGTGLGLSLTEAVAKLHGGRLMLTSNTPTGLKAILTVSGVV